MSTPLGNAGALKDDHGGEDDVDGDNGTVCSEFNPSSLHRSGARIARFEGEAFQITEGAEIKAVGRMEENDDERQDTKAAITIIEGAAFYEGGGMDGSARSRRSILLILLFSPPTGMAVFTRCLVRVSVSGLGRGIIDGCS